ncbi:MAG: DNA polymerase III subunit epsilon [Rhodobacteraceae bacterium]|nr:DNA polymerase III subunit epsilon [Paracoccaceae bacterium]
MREIVLDTETTGLDPSTGDRIVEIGAVEIFNHMPTGETYHQYINPERDMPAGAFAVHGLSEAFLSDKPVFASIAKEFLEFIGNSRLIIHNAAFDMKFLNAELKGCRHPIIPMDQALDTLAIARKKFAGAQNSLDALCRRFGIDNSSRTLHGALLDSEILAEVYLELVGGRQPDFALKVVKNTGSALTGDDYMPPARPGPLSARLTQDENTAHAAFIKALGGEGLWKD